LAAPVAGRHLQPHPEPRMFPEYCDLITKLKTTDHHFTRLFDQHNALDQKITNMENHVEQGTPLEIENLKKEKLLLKDQLYVILKKAAAEQ
jgi:hypothetical protein